MHSLSLVRLAFKGKKVQRDCNNRERGNYLDTVEKFIQTCHMISCVIVLQGVVSVYRR
jgi:hypothetical protein